MDILKLNFLNMCINWLRYFDIDYMLKVLVVFCVYICFINMVDGVL